MQNVRPKKGLGQHFLVDKNIASKIAHSLQLHDIEKVIEVGPGMGILTDFLFSMETETYIIEIDTEAIQYLSDKYPDRKEHIIHADFLRYDLNEFSKGKQIAIVGNFPYHISTQILFKAFDNKHIVGELVGMFQLEVGRRITQKPGTKDYGILSVLLQAFYDMEFLFSVNETVFRPPPRVKSGVIRMTRNKVETLGCDEKLFFRLVKAAFNQRRKTLRNSLKQFLTGMPTEKPIFNNRPEQLGVAEFVEIASFIEQFKTSTYEI